MSTKSTIAHGRGFHFYHEALDESGVYLELEDVEFEAGYRRVMVKIPIDVWEVIRHTAPARLDLVDSSDEDLRRTVERQVDERVAEYERVKGDSRGEALVSLCGSLVFGGADEPRERQIRKGVEYYTRERGRQRQVAARIKEHLVRPEGMVYVIRFDEPKSNEDYSRQ
jgi:hypothetical protein